MEGQEQDQAWLCTCVTRNRFGSQALHWCLNVTMLIESQGGSMPVPCIVTERGAASSIGRTSQYHWQREKGEV